MKLKSLSGAVIEASDAHAEILLKSGWVVLEEPKPEPKPAPKTTRRAAAKPKE